MFSDEITRYDWDAITQHIAQKSASDVEVALSKRVCDIEDFMALISPAAAPFCLLSFPALGYFPMSQLFPSGGQSIGASASALVLPIKIQG